MRVNIAGKFISSISRKIIRSGDKVLVQVLCIFLAFPPHIFAPLAYAAPVVDPTAPISQRPNIGQASNGVPLINIAAPQGNGISHNRYQDFDIESEGLIFNNALISGQSQLGGNINANPNFGSQTADVILNEIRGTSDTQLEGPAEVFGDNANVIIANPNGVSCSGCGFINTGRATLTTAVPNIDTAGDLELSVTQGTVSVTGDGIVYGGQLDLLGRRVTIDGEVTANNALNVLAGRLDYQYSDSEGSNAPITDHVNANSPAEVNGAPPAIDASAFGALRSGQINLLATDQGLGVRTLGYMGTNADDLFVQSAGDIEVTVVESNQDITLNAAGDVIQNSLVHANQNVNINADNYQGAATADIIALDTINITATNDINKQGQSLSTNLNLNAGGNLTTQNHNLAINQINLQAGSNINLANGSTDAVSINIQANNDLNANNSVIFADDIQTVQARDINIDGATSIESLNTPLNLTATRDINNAGALAASTVNANANRNINQDGLILANSINLDAQNNLNNAGQLDANTINLQASVFNNQSSGFIEALIINLNIDSATTTSANAGALIAHTEFVTNGVGDFANNAYLATSIATINNGNFGNTGDFLVTDLLSLNSGSFSNSGYVQSDTDTAINLTGNLSNTGDIVLDGNVQPINVGGTLQNDGLLVAADAIDITADSYTSTSGELSSFEEIDINVTGDVTLDNAVVDSLTDVDVTSGGDVALTDSLINAQQTLDVSAQTISTIDTGVVSPSLNATDLTVNATGTATNSSGWTADNLNVTSDQLDNSGIIEADALTVDVDTVNNQSNGVLRGESSFTVTADTINNAVNAYLLGLNGLNMTTTGDVDNAGELLSSSVFGLNVGGHLTNSGALASQGALTIDASSINNSGSIDSLSSATINGGSDIANTGLIDVLTDVALTATTVNNDGDVVGDNVDVNADNFTNQSNGQLVANVFNANVSNNFNNAGRLYTNISNLITGINVNNSGEWTADTLLNLLAANFTNSGYLESSTQTLFGLNGDFDNSGDVIIADGLTLSTTGTVQNDGLLVTGEALSISAASYGSTGGELSSFEEIDINVTGDVTLDNAVVDSLTDVTVASGGDVALTDSLINAQQTLDVSAQTISTIDTGVVSPSLNATDLTVNATGTATNSSGWTADNLNVTSDQLDNSGIIEADALTVDVDTVNNQSNGVLRGESSFTVTADTINNAVNAYLLGLNGLNMTTTGDVDNAGELLSSSVFGLNVGGHLTNSGALASQGALTIDASSINNSGSIDSLSSATINGGSDIANTGLIDVLTDVALTATTVNNDGDVVGDTVSVTADSFTNQSNGQLVASVFNANVSTSFDNAGGLYTGTSNFTTGIDLNNSGEWIATTFLNLTVTDFINSGYMQSDALTALNINGDVDNSGSLIVVDGLNISTTGTVQNDGLLVTGEALTITASSYSSTGGEVSSFDDITLNTTGDVTLDNAVVDSLTDVDVTSGGDVVLMDSLINAQQQLTINAQNISTVDTGVVSPSLNAVDLVVNATGMATNSSGWTADNLNVTSNQLDNSGIIEADALSVDVNTVNNQSNGVLRGESSFTVTADTINNAVSAYLLGLNGLDITTTGDVDNAGELLSSSVFGLNVGGHLTNSGALASQDVLTIDANSVNNSGSIDSLSSATINGGSSMTNTGLIDVLTDVALNATTIDNDGDVVGDTVSVTADNFTNQSNGQLVASVFNANVSTSFDNAGGLYTGTSNFTTGIGLNNSGEWIATTFLNLTVTDFINSGYMQSDALTALNINGDVDNSGDVIIADGLTLSTTGTVQNDGLLVTGEALSVTAASYTSTGGEVSSFEEIDINVTGDVTLDNAVVDSLTDVTVASGGDVALTDSLINAQQTLDVSAQNLSTIDTGVVSPSLNATDLTVNATGTATNSSGWTADNLNVTSDQLDNSGIIEADALSVDVNTVNNQSNGVLRGESSFTVTAQTINNAVSAYLLGLNGLNMTTTGNVDNAGELLSSSVFGLNVGGNLTNSGALASQDVLTIDAASINNSGSIDSLASATINGGSSMTNTGLIDILTDVALTATTVNNDGDVVGDNVDVNADNFTNQSNGQLVASVFNANVSNAFDNQGALYTGTSNFTTGIDLNNSGEWIASTFLNLTVADFINSGYLQSDVQTTLNVSGDVDNSGDVIIANGLALSTTGTVQNDGLLVTGEALSISAASYGSTGGELSSFEEIDINVTGDVTLDNAVVDSLTDVDVTSGGDVALTDSLINAEQQLDINAQNLNTHNIGSIEAALVADNLNANVANTVINNSEWLANTLVLNATQLYNSGVIEAGDLTVDVNTVNNQNNGLLRGITDTFVIIADEINNLFNAAIYGIAGLDITTTGAINNDGELVSGGALDLDIDALFDNSGTIASQGALTIDGQTGFVNSGDIVGYDTANLISQVSLINSGAIDVLGNLNVTANGQVNNTGSLISQLDLILNSASLLNNNAGRLLGNNVAINTSGFAGVDNLSDMAATQQLSINAASLDNYGLLQANDLDLTIVNRIYNTNVMQGFNSITTNSDDLTNYWPASIVSNGAISITTVDSLNNSGGSIPGNDGGIATFGDGSSIVLNVGGQYSNSGVVVSDGTLTVDANRMINSTTGNIYAFDNTVFTTNFYLQNTGLIDIRGDLTFNVTDDLTNGAGGTIAAFDTLTINAENFNNQAAFSGNEAGIVYAFNLNLNLTDNITGNEGTLLVDNQLNITTPGDYENLGLIEGNHLQITHNNDLVNFGEIHGLNTLSIHAENIQNGSFGSLGTGIIYSEGDAYLQSTDASGGVYNYGELLGALSGSGTLFVDVMGEFYNRYLLVSGNDLSVTAGTDFRNFQEITYVGGDAFFDLGRTFSNFAGSVTVGGDLDIVTGQFVNSGNSLGLTGNTVTTTRLVSRVPGGVFCGGPICSTSVTDTIRHYEADELDVEFANVSAGGDIYIEASGPSSLSYSVYQEMASLQAAGNITIDSGTYEINNTGTLITYTATHDEVLVHGCIHGLPSPECSNPPPPGSATTITEVASNTQSNITAGGTIQLTTNGASVNVEGEFAGQAVIIDTRPEDSSNGDSSNGGSTISGDSSHYASDGSGAVDGSSGALAGADDYQTNSTTADGASTGVLGDVGDYDNSSSANAGDSGIDPGSLAGNGLNASTGVLGDVSDYDNSGTANAGDSGVDPGSLAGNGLNASTGVLGDVSDYDNSGTANAGDSGIDPGSLLGNALDAITGLLGDITGYDNSSAANPDDSGVDPDSLNGNELTADSGINIGIADYTVLIPEPQLPPAAIDLSHFDFILNSASLFDSAIIQDLINNGGLGGGFDLTPDYLLDGLDITDANLSFYADPFQETLLLQQAALQQTGSRFFSSEWGTDLEQRQALYDNAIAFYENQDGLALGEALTDEQITQLVAPILWYEWRDVAGQQQLVPVVYLSDQDRENLTLQGQGRIIADNANLITDRDFVNHGSLFITDTLNVSARDIVNRPHAYRPGSSSHLVGGDITAYNINFDATRDIFSGRGRYMAGGDINFRASRDIIDTVGQYHADGNLNMFAGRDLEQRAFVDRRVVRTGGTTRTTTETETSHYTADGDIALHGDRELSLQATDLTAGRNISLSGGDINLNNIERLTETETRRKRFHSIEREVRHDVVDLNAGDNIFVTATGDLNSYGAQINAGEDANDSIIINAEGDINLWAVQNEDYSYSQKTKKKSFGRKKTTTRESLTIDSVGTSLRAGGNVLMNIEGVDENGQLITRDSGNINLEGSDIEVEGTAILHADEDINVYAAAELDYYKKTVKKRGALGLTNESRGSVRRDELLQGTELSARQGDLSLLSDQNIMIAASDLNAGGDINLQAVDDVLISAGEEVNLRQEWSESSGMFTNDSLYSKETSRDAIATVSARSANLNAGNNININSGRATVVGSNLLAGNNIQAATDIGDIQILAARESEQSQEYDQSITVGVGDMLSSLTDPEGTISTMIDDASSGEKAKFKLADAQYDEFDQRINTVRHASSNLVANNNVILDSIGDLLIEGSNIGADANLDGAGDATLISRDGDVIIKEAEDSRDTVTEEVHGSAELSFVVQHQAVEVAKAVIQAKEARDQLKQAKEDYRKYKKDLKNLETELGQLQVAYDNDEPGVSYDDLVELSEIIDDMHDDEDWYKAGIAAAAVHLTSATTNVVQQTAAAAASASTYGFNAGVQLDIEASKSHTETNETTSLASTISGSNINIQTGAENTDTQTLIQGSHLMADNAINIATDNLNVLASKDTFELTNETEQASVSISQTVYGAAGGPSVSGSYSRSRDRNRQTTWNNSSLTADNINLAVEGDAVFNGANVHADSNLVADITGDLKVESKQNRGNGNNNSFGISAGFSMSGSDNGNNVNSVNGGVNASNGRSRSRQTVLTSLTGGEVDINVGGHTRLVGAQIAAVDEEGNDNGNLNLSTETFDFADLTNTTYSSQQSAGVSSSIGLNQGNNQNGETETNVNIGTSSVQYSNTSDYDKGKTLATIGQGNFVIRDEANSDDISRLNRDSDNIDRDLFSVERQESIDTVIPSQVVEAVVGAVGQTVELVGNGLNALGDVFDGSDNYSHEELEAMGFSAPSIDLSVEVNPDVNIEVDLSETLNEETNRDQSDWNADLIADRSSQLEDSITFNEDIQQRHDQLTQNIENEHAAQAAHDATVQEIFTEINDLAAINSYEMEQSLSNANTGTDLSDESETFANYSEWRAPQIAEHEAIYGPRNDLGDTAGDLLDIGVTMTSGTTHFIVDDTAELIGLGVDVVDLGVVDTAISRYNGEQTPGGDVSNAIQSGYDDLVEYATDGEPGAWNGGHNNEELRTALEIVSTVGDVRDIAGMAQNIRLGGGEYARRAANNADSGHVSWPDINSEVNEAYPGTIRSSDLPNDGLTDLIVHDVPSAQPRSIDLEVNPNHVNPADIPEVDVSQLPASAFDNAAPRVADNVNNVPRLPAPSTNQTANASSPATTGDANPVIGEMGRPVGELPDDTVVYRYEPANIDTPMQPHESPFFDGGKAGEYGLSTRGGQEYDALFVVSGEGNNLDRLTDLRNRQGYFEDDVVLNQTTISEIRRQNPDAQILSDFRFNGTVLGESQGGYIITVPRRPAVEPANVGNSTGPTTGNSVLNNNLPAPSVDQVTDTAVRTDIVSVNTGTRQLDNTHVPPANDAMRSVNDDVYGSLSDVYQPTINPPSVIDRSRIANSANQPIYYDVPINDLVINPTTITPTSLIPAVGRVDNVGEAANDVIRSANDITSVSHQRRTQRVTLGEQPPVNDAVHPNAVPVDVRTITRTSVPDNVRDMGLVPREYDANFWDNLDPYDPRWQFYPPDGPPRNLSAARTPDNTPDLGDLTQSEVDGIQDFVNQLQTRVDDAIGAGEYQVRLDVVGSAARGTRRNPGTDLPIGHGPGTRSDIDYLLQDEDALRDFLTQGPFDRFEDTLPAQLPDYDRFQGIMGGTARNNEAAITFTADGTPVPSELTTRLRRERNELNNIQGNAIENGALNDRINARRAGRLREELPRNQTTTVDNVDTQALPPFNRQSQNIIPGDGEFNDFGMMSRDTDHLVLRQDGPTCLGNACAMALDSLGINVPADEVIDRIGDQQNLDHAAEVLAEYGVNANVVRNVDREALLQTIDHSTSQGVPAIVTVDRLTDAEAKLQLEDYIAQGVPREIAEDQVRQNRQFDAHAVVVDGVTTTQNGERVVLVRDSDLDDGAVIQRRDDFINMRLDEEFLSIDPSGQGSTPPTNTNSGGSPNKIGADKSRGSQGETAREQLQNLDLSADSFSIKGSIPADSKVFVRAEVDMPGVVEVTDIFKGGLPKGSGSDLLASTLRGHNALPTRQLVFKNITNEPTVNAYSQGLNPAESVLGKTGTKALQQLGLRASDYTFEIKRGKLNLVIDVE